MLNIRHTYPNRKVYPIVITWGLASLIIGCTSKEAPPLREPTAPVVDEVEVETTTEKIPDAEEADAATSTLSHNQRMFKRLVLDDADLTVHDEQLLLSGTEAPPVDSEREALLAAIIAKYVIKLNNPDRSYQEKELISTPDSTEKLTGAQVSLEALTLEKELDLPRAIRTNPTLHNLQFFKLALKALKSSNNSAAFINTLNQTIAYKLQSWNVGQNANVGEGSGDEKANGANWQHAVDAAADVRITDNILVEAQLFADNRRYQEAILKVSQISKDSPLYAQAHAKIVEFSDRAVQDLRQKAAQAFQTSLPLGDPNARAVYLTKAKEHLEEALNRYPNAPVDQLETIKANLDVITQQLEKLGS